MVIWIFLASLIISVPAVLTGSASFITIPLLIHFGLSPHIAVATNKPGIFIMMLSGAIGFRTHLKEAPKSFWLLPVLMMAGGMTGAHLLRFLPSSAVKWTILVLALIAAFPYQRILNQSKTYSNHPGRWIWAFMIILSLYNGMLGPGTLTLLISTLRFRLGLSMQAAIAWGTLTGCLGNLGAILQFYQLGLIDIPAAFAMTAGMFLGSQLGVRAGRRLPTPVLEWLIRIVLVGLVIGLILRNS